MLMKLLPGLAVALALGVFFSMPQEKAGRDAAASRAVKPGVDAASHADAGLGAAPVPAFIATAEADGNHSQSIVHTEMETPNDVSAALPANAAPLLLVLPKDPALAAAPDGIFAMAPAMRIPDRETVGREFAGSGGAFASLSWNAAPKSAARGTALSSSSAFAVPNYFNHTEIVSPEPPPKGIRVWGDARAFQENQKPRNFGSSVYRHNGNVYTLGVKRDWSMDSVLGVSANLLDSTLKSRHPGDGRRDEIQGYMFNAHYNGLIAAKFPIDLNAGYGRIENRTRGSLRFPGYASAYSWQEDKHNSDIFEASGGIGVPTILWDRFKVLGEIRVKYRSVKSKAYDFRFDNITYGAPKASSSSLTMPLMTTISEDFVRRWGIITTRVSVGKIFEFDDDGLQARAYNSSAAYGVAYDPATKLLADPFYDRSQNDYLHFGAGVDVKTVGGWEVKADYIYRIADRYRSGEFKLELGRCF